VTLHSLSHASLFIYSSHGKWAFPTSCGVFLPPLLQAFPLLVARQVPPLLLPSSTGLFIYSSMGDCLSLPLRHSGHPVLFTMCLFCCCCLLFSFFFLFSLGGGQSDQGAMLIWPRVVCGSTACHLAHLVVCIFPSSLGAGVWLHESPPGFSI
jgi:hypothetical protein